MHNHDMFRSYELLKTSNHRDILLKILLGDSQNNQDVSEVLKVIVEYMEVRGLMDI